MEAQKTHAAKHEAHENKREERAVDAAKPDKSEEGKKEGRTQGAPRGKKVKNNVRKLRMERMMSKAELARRSGLSTLTVDRVERGMSCRMDTKRKILEALGLKPQDRVMVFGDAEED
jgi:ribosome-binding protein aMBF1 (putative translation factor)